MGFFTKLFFGDVKKREKEALEAERQAALAEKAVLWEENIKKFPYLASLDNVFEYSQQPVLCDCCEDETKIYSSCGIYSEEGEYENLCPDCIASGVAAEQSNGFFNCLEDGVVDSAEAQTVSKKTPTLPTNQDYNWKVCCGKPCVYLKRATQKDAEELNLFEELKEDLLREDIPLEDLGELLGDDEDSSLIMLFRCKECGKIHAIVDLD